MTTRVLICDDHEVVREGLRDLISRQAAMSVVGEAGTVAESIEAASRAKPDVVIKDVRLPDGSGVEGSRARSMRHDRRPRSSCLPRTPMTRRSSARSSPARPAIC